MKNIFILFSLGLVWINFTANSQTPTFDSTISINQTFTTFSEIYPFNGTQMYGAGVSGTINFNSDTAIVKIILRDSLSVDYLIYETNTFLDTTPNFTFSEACEETCFFDGFTPTSIELQIVGASVTIGSFKYCSTTLLDATALQDQARDAKVTEKIGLMNQYIQNEGLIWVAGQTSYLSMYYNDKKDLYKSCIWHPAIEYYSYGFFSLKSISNGANIGINYDYVDNFEWRNRHGANDPTSYYFDGSDDGSGWVTKAACQNGCWTNDVLDCSVFEWQCGSGSEWRSVGTCWAFGPTSHIEALVNLYLNFHYDVDLAEQEIVSCSMSTPWPYPGFATSSYSYFENYGVVDEDCFPYTAQATPCSERCLNPDEQIKIDNYNTLNHPSQEVLRETVINDGPVSATFMNCMWGTWAHSMELVGWDVIEWGDEDILGIPPDPMVFGQYVGCTYWIYKQNLGNRDDMNGFQYMIHENDDTPVLYIVPTITQNFVSSVQNTFDSSDIACLDTDDDGYFNWGIGPKPAQCPPCPDLPDGDDTDPGLGPLDEHGFCTIIDTYNSDFEKTMCNWKQSENDDCDWVKYHGATASNPTSGPNGTPDGSTYYIYMNASQCYTNSGAYIESTKIDLEEACAIEMTFAYHKNTYTWGNDETDDSKLSLDISYDNGQTWVEDYWYVMRDQGDQWHYVTLTLPSEVNKVRFYAYVGWVGFYNDIALDDITIGPAENTNIIISGTTVWDNPKYELCKDIIIEPGASLTLNNTTIHMLSPEARIIVKRNAHLVVNQSTITTYEGEMWKGIEVWGNSLATNVPANQGWMQIHNNSKIENATMGVYTNRPIPETDGWMQNYTGGIVQLIDAEFTNNKTCIQFFPYSYPSLSTISNCSFVVNDDYYGVNSPESFIEFSGMSAVRIINSDFINETSTDHQFCGISSVNSIFFVEAECSSGTTPCTSWDKGLFQNLEYGIYATATNATNYPDVRNTEFTDNYRGIYLSGISLARVTSNEFCPNNATGYGLYLDGCTGYWVEDNEFNNCHNFLSPTGIGIIVNESGGDPNEIYLNIFNGVEYAINVQGENRSSLNPDEGLVLKCNYYNGTKYDETIMWDEPRLNRAAGIAGEQGTGTFNIEDMAGNIFFYENHSTDYDDLNNEANFFDYYYSTNAGDAKVEPMDAQFGVTVEKHGMYTPVQWTLETACESNINTGGGGTEEEMGIMNEAQEGIETTEGILTALIDGGDTETLNIEVQTSVPPEAVEVYNELMVDSPNLSETVVETTIEKEEVLPNAMIRDVMVANPHTAKSISLLEKLDERFDPMPDYMKAQILTGRSIQNLKQELEAELAWYKLKKARAMNNLVHYYNEQLDPQAASDSVISLYEEDNTLKSSYRLAWLYLEKGEYLLGNITMNNIPVLFSLSDNEQLVYNQMTGIYSILSNLRANGCTIDSLTASQVNEFHVLASEGAQRPCAYARNILLALDEIAYDEPILFPNLLKSSEAKVGYENLINAQPPQILEVYPNPSKDFVILKYKLDTEQEGIIEIQDVSGKTIQILQFTEIQDQITVATQDWNAGLYIASIIMDGKSIESIKFTLVK